MTLAKSLQAAAGNAAAEGTYIEDVFSTYLYTGTGAAQTITNGIDLAGEGGLVWLKSRSNAYDNWLYDTVRGNTVRLISNTTAAQGSTGANGITSFNTNGFGLGAPFAEINGSGATYASWTFRKQPKFFDVVTYTGDGVAGRTVAHALGSVPGCMMVKATSTTSNWATYHASLGANQALFLNTTNAFLTSAIYWNNTAPTSAVFTLGDGSAGNLCNTAGVTYVAYLFAHDAGGFGESGEENVISCGSYTGNGSATGPSISLGYEPQWVMIKCASDVSNWSMIDNMRGFNSIDGAANVALMYANLSSAEVQSQKAKPLSTGFQINDNGSAVNTSGATYIYIAIRKGPMKVPTDATKVFAPLTFNNSTGTVNTTGFPVDMQIQKDRTYGLSAQLIDRLRGLSTTSSTGGVRLFTAETTAETAFAVGTNFNNTGFSTGAGWDGLSVSYYNWRRAPGFFDEVCWTGNNSTNQRVSHNLGVAPELIIYKGRNKVNYWRVYFGDINKYIQLDAGIAAVSGSNFWGSSAPTTTDFGINCGSMDLDNFNAVGYLFATCPGVSKVFSFTGNGSSQTINCGFTGGSRFILIKCTSTTGDWYVWDTARGVVAGTDPHLSLNTTAAEVTTDDTIDPDSSGFIVNQVAATNVNVNGATYIGLAIS